MGHHETKYALRDALAGLVIPSPGGPIRTVLKGRPDLFSDLHRALCVFPLRSEALTNFDTPNVFRFGVAGVHPSVPTIPGVDGRPAAEEAASRAASAWIDALQNDPVLDEAILERPVMRVSVESERSDDADEFGSEYTDQNGQSIWINGLEVRVELM